MLKLIQQRNKSFPLVQLSSSCPHKA